ncbi:MAG TPA: arsenate reductase family protein [Polyangiaceae bacterium]|nr:arsenate reductase family protein [Polyangiaceae bacterium]
MLTVYHYPKCSTCRNALRWLDAHGIRHERIDIVQTPPSSALLGRVLEQSGAPIARLFNTSGQSYREGNYKERLKQMSRSEALAALAADGKLIKRPLVVASDVALIGFDADEYEAALGARRGGEQRAT